MEKKKADILDEVLKVLYLESVTDASAERELSRITNEFPTAEMSPLQKAKLFERLSAIEPVNTLGEIISNRLKELHLEADQLSHSTSLPLNVVHDLMEDKIYTNNVPIMFFRNLLNRLGISFQQSEKSIRKTFALLQANISKPTSNNGLNPAFRKGPHILGVTNVDAHTKGDHRELYENKEALEKYLTRLNELLID